MIHLAREKAEREGELLPLHGRSVLHRDDLGNRLVGNPGKVRISRVQEDIGDFLGRIDGTLQFLLRIHHEGGMVVVGVSHKNAVDSGDETAGLVFEEALKLTSPSHVEGETPLVSEINSLVVPMW